MEIVEIKTELLVSFEGNPRIKSVIREGLLQDIKKRGILVPLLVSPNGKKYDVIDGERRRKSAIKLKIPKVPCIIEDMDEETKWQRAYDLNVLNRPFTPMEDAKHFYERMVRFKQSTRMLADPSSGRASQSNIQRLIALVKLPEEVQELVHKRKLAIEPAYELSRLAFDVRFPNTGGLSPKKWVAKQKGRVWDFSWYKEPQEWKDKRIKLQIDLADRYLRGKLY